MGVLRLNPAGMLTTLAIVAATCAGVVAAFSFVDAEKQREMQAWQIRLGIVADNRASDVTALLDDRFTILREITDNASVQLYMTELLMAEGDRTKVTDEPAQAGYLRNLLTATAQHAGFTVPAPAGEVGANVERLAVAGIAITDAHGAPVVATIGMPPLGPVAAAAVAEALRGKPSLADIHRAATGEPVIGFALPLHAVQGEATRAIGAVVGVMPVGKSLFDRLRQPGELSETAETYLIRAAASAGQIDYLSPLGGETEPLKRTLARSTPDLADAMALDRPGEFALVRDYAGTEVLALSRAITGTPWMLVRKVSRAEALGPAEARLRIILTVLVLVIVGVAGTMIAVWRHGASLRAAEAAEKHRMAAERFEKLTRFMRVVTDSQPTHILCCTGDGLITFANKPLAAHYDIPVVDIKNKPMASVLGPVKAHVLAEINKRVLETGAAERHLQRLEEADGVRTVVTDHVHVPDDGTNGPTTLTVFHDITELARERERSEHRQHQLVAALVSVVDRRDPYSAHHSERVAEIARAIAEEMGLDQFEAATVELAGRLMNIGKIFIPPDLLTKVGQLSDEERNLLARSFVVTGDLLKDVDFDGPVVETIRQIGESWDGTGPLALAAEDILRTARIVAVANTFVGMISPRAYRAAMPLNEACTVLQGLVGRKFERGPVSALINIIDNRDGAQRWSRFREQPSE